MFETLCVNRDQSRKGEELTISTEAISFDAFIRQWARERPDCVALEQDGRSLTFAELDAHGRKAVTYLSALGLKPGDRIAWLGKNSLIYFSLFYAAARFGIVSVPIGWRLTAPEIAFILKDTGASLLVAEEDFRTIAKEATDSLRTSVMVMGADEVDTAIAESLSEGFAPCLPDHPVLQLYTSGTTGNPKGVVLSNRNLFSLRTSAGWDLQPWANWDWTETVLICMPCAHIGGAGLCINALANGVRAIIQREFSPEGVLDALGAGITRLFIVPAALRLIIQHPRAATTDFSGLRYIYYGASPIPLELLRDAVQAMPGAGFLQCYGMTETTGTVAMLTPGDHTIEGNRRMRSIGKAVPGAELKVVSADGTESAVDETGELWVRSPSNMLGYWNLPEETQAALADGWMRTGDAAYRDEDGYVYIQDRIKDMIISGGENVYPAEVESAIHGHPGVVEVAVFGVPDETWGEAVVATCVPRAGAVLDADEIIAFARERLAGYKVSKRIFLSDALPRNQSGKVLRRVLREPYWEGRERQVN